MGNSISVRLDETGTDGISPYVVVAGAVATSAQWDNLEQGWARLLKSRGVSNFHSKEFKDRSGEFSGWGNLKCKNFSSAQRRIVNNNVLFRVAVGVEKKTHEEIKKRMRGIKGFSPDSDYGLCLRYLMFAVCDEIAQENPQEKVDFLLEDGPFATGAMELFGRVRKMTGKWKPARHAHMLGKISVLPKGTLFSLEAADYLAEIALRQMKLGRFAKKTGNQHSILLNKNFLLEWEVRMWKEKEARRQYGRRTKNPS